MDVLTSSLTGVGRLRKGGGPCPVHHILACKEIGYCELKEDIVIPRGQPVIV